MDIKDIKRTLEDFKKGQEDRETKRDLQKVGIKDNYWDNYKKMKYEKERERIIKER